MVYNIYFSPEGSAWMGTSTACALDHPPQLLRLIKDHEWTGGVNTLLFYVPGIFRNLDEYIFPNFRSHNTPRMCHKTPRNLTIG